MRHSTRSRANEATDGRPLRKKAKTEPDQHDPEAEGGEPQQEIAKKDDAKTAQAPTWGVPQPEWDALLRKHSLTRVSMDFYDLYALAAHLSPESPLDAFVDTVGIRLCGPFDLLSRHGETLQVHKPLCLQGRHFVDPAEVTTVLMDTRSQTGKHWSFYRDEPDQAPLFVVACEDSSECCFEIAGPTLFHVLDDRVKQAQRPKKSPDAYDELKRLVGQYISSHGGASAAVSVASLRSQRSKAWTASSLHSLGIVVPYNAKTRTGFRDLPVTGKALRTLLQQVDSNGSKTEIAARAKLNDLITRATIANDECDFGTSLLLGLDLFAMGSALEKEMLKLLRVSYMLLRRMNFYKITAEHVKHRRSSSSQDRDQQQQAIAIDCLTPDPDAVKGPVELALPSFASN